MILTHLVMFGFFPGAGDSVAPAVVPGLRSRTGIGVGVGIGICLLLFIIPRVF